MQLSHVLVLRVRRLHAPFKNFEGFSWVYLVRFARIGRQEVFRDRIQVILDYSAPQITVSELSKCRRIKTFEVDSLCHAALLHSLSQLGFFSGVTPHQRVQVGLPERLIR